MTTDAIPVNINVNHGVGQIDNVIGYPTKAWRATRKYSVNNTLPIAAVNAWLQFSLAYVAAIIITHNDLSFIPAIFNPTLMSAYALVSVVLVAVFLTSLILKYIKKQEIKEEKKENTKEEKLIDEKIRGGKPDEISEIAKDALKIEIIPDLSDIGYKKQNFSIILPISEEQNKILENQKEENRNKVILLTIPYVISAAIILSALIQNRFSLANIQGRLEISFISLVFIVAAVSICITLSKLRNNEVNHKDNYIKKFDNLYILLPWRKGSIISVMKGQTTDQEENGPLSRLIRLFDTHLTNFTDKIVNSFDKHLDEAKGLLDKKFLEPANANIKETLDRLKGIREDIKKDLDELHKEISTVLNDAKQITGKVNSLDIEGAFSQVQNAIKTFYDAVKAVKDKIEGLQLRSYIGYFAPSTQSGQGNGNNQNQGDNESFHDAHDWEVEIGELKKKLEKLKKSLEELKNKQPQSSEPDNGYGSGSSSNDSLNLQEDEETKLRKVVEGLEKQERIGKLQEKKEELERKLEELPKQKEWKEKINGPASEFLRYVLGSIILKAKNTQQDEGVGATLQDCNNKIIIYWKDGSQTTCYMSKDGNLQVQPNTTVNFVDPKIQVGFAVACAG